MSETHYAEFKRGIKNFIVDWVITDGHLSGLIKSDVSLLDMGLDSIDIFELVTDIEDNFNTTIEVLESDVPTITIDELTNTTMTSLMQGIKDAG